MRIAIDCRYVRIGTHDGISRYTARIVEALAPLADAAGHDLVMIVSDPRQLDMLPDLPSHRVSGPTSPREPFVATQIGRTGADVLFSPMQTVGSAGRTYGLVLTLHDLIYYVHRTPPRDLPAPVRLLWRLYHLAWWPQRLLLNRADEVVTVSATTRELMQRHRLTRRRVTVVRNAPDPAAGASAGRQAPTSRELVYMGSFMPYKGVETLARAMHRLPDWTLHLMSRVRPETRTRLETIAPPGALVFHDGASDEEYREVLSRATALVHASKDEGFGIPLVEAMVLGTPVVVSDTAIFREIGGDAAAYFPVGDDAALATAVAELERPAAWAKRSRASYAQAGRFDWSTSAAELLQVLERVAASRRG
jgi:glycosyltransferase involved in cell wall biosynthesis